MKEALCPTCVTVNETIERLTAPTDSLKHAIAKCAHDFEGSWKGQIADLQDAIKNELERKFLSA